MPPAIIADRYHVLRELGRGGMGVVYQVMHNQTGEQHALKVLLAHKSAKGDSVERFKRELKIPAHIKSEHVVQVIDSGEVKEEDGAPFYVMELLRGCDLRKLVDTEHAFTPQEILWILRPLAQGLSQAHEIGIVHRDLKPDNIFLHCRDEERLVVKVLDFGIARYAQELLETGAQGKLTATQAMLGTPLYMAPEQAKAGEGRTEIGPCTDVWAVGMIVFELLTGRTYWTADSVMAHLGQLLFAPMPLASQKAKGLPSGFDAWFARSCNRESSQRYQSVREQIAELEKVLAVQAPDAEPPAALLAAVKKHRPLLVEQDSPTVISRMPNIPKLAARATNTPGHGSAEQNLRAELIPQPQSQMGSAPRINPRLALGGVLIVCLGFFALALTWFKSSNSARSSRLAPDGGTVGRDLAVSTDLAPPADLAPSASPADSTAAHKPAGADSKRPARTKSRSPSSRDDAPPSRRTYIPPSL